MKRILFTRIIRILSIIFLMNLSPDAWAQLSKPILDSLYANNDFAALGAILENKHLETVEEFNELKNDSLIVVEQLFNRVFDMQSKDTNVKYFFLQPFSSMFNKNTGYYVKAPFLIGHSNNHNRRPIKHDKISIAAIVEFLGPDPFYSNILIKEFLNNPDNMEPKKKIEAERIMREYSDRLKFINRVVHVPTSMIGVRKTMVPFEINSLEFNYDMTEAEIKYSATTNGATEIYMLLDGRWIKHRTLIKWIE